MMTYGYSRVYILAGKNRVLVLSYKPLIWNIFYSFIRPNGNSLLHNLWKLLEETIWKEIFKVVWRVRYGRIVTFLAFCIKKRQYSLHSTKKNCLRMNIIFSLCMKRRLLSFIYSMPTETVTIIIWRKQFPTSN